MKKSNGVKRVARTMGTFIFVVGALLQLGCIVVMFAAGYDPILFAPLLLVLLGSALIKYSGSKLSQLGTAVMEFLGFMV